MTMCADFESHTSIFDHIMSLYGLAIDLIDWKLFIDGPLQISKVYSITMQGILNNSFVDVDTPNSIPYFIFLVKFPRVLGDSGMILTNLERYATTLPHQLILTTGDLKYLTAVAQEFIYRGKHESIA